MAHEDEIRGRLWNVDIGPAEVSGANEKYTAAVLDQYKLYVEMADRISARRALANTFFLTLNTAVLALYGAASNHLPPSPLFLLPALIALVGGCVAWFWIVRSYRLLNTGKYDVVAVLEERLPAFCYSRGEWKALGEGKDWRRYLPLSHIEQWIPCLFTVVYLTGFIALTVQ